jgi:hypothetical protein
MRRRVVFLLLLIAVTSMVAADPTESQLVGTWTGTWCLHLHLQGTTFINVTVTPLSNDNVDIYTFAEGGLGFYHRPGSITRIPFVWSAEGTVLNVGMAEDRRVFQLSFVDEDTMIFLEKTMEPGNDYFSGLFQRQHE